MHTTLPTADTAEALLSLFASEFPEGSKPSLLPKYDDQFRARIEAPAGPVTILIPRRTLAAFASSQFDHERCFDPRSGASSASGSAPRTCVPTW